MPQFPGDIRPHGTEPAHSGVSGPQWQTKPPSHSCAQEAGEEVRGRWVVDILFCSLLMSRGPSDRAKLPLHCLSWDHANQRPSFTGLLPMRALRNRIYLPAGPRTTPQPDCHLKCQEIKYSLNNVQTCKIYVTISCYTKNQRNYSMNENVGLTWQNFNTTVIQMLQQALMNSLETGEENRKFQQRNRSYEELNVIIELKTQAPKWKPHWRS